MNRRVQLLLAWCGPAAALIFAIGFIPLAGFIPVISPHASAEEVKLLYLDKPTSVRIGLLMCMTSMSLFAPWAVGIVVQYTGKDKATRALNYVQLTCMAIGVALIVLAMIVWGVASFRPDDLSPESTRMLNDFGWFLLLWPWPPFAIWCVAVGLAILTDEDRAYPRWAAYLSFFAAADIVPQSLLIFFKSGPFGFSGIIACYIPVSVFFGWQIVMTVMTIKAVNREATSMQACSIKLQQASSDSSRS